MKRRQYISALLVKGASVAALFGVQVLVARTASDDGEYGFFNYLISILNIASLVVIWGLDKFLVREVSIDLEEGNHGRAWAQIRGARKIIWVNLLVAAPALTAILFWTRPERSSWTLVLFVWLLLVAISFARSTTSVMRGMQRVIASEAALNLLRPLALGLGVLLFAWLGGPLSAPNFVLLATGSFGLTALVAAVICRRSVAPTAILMPSEAVFTFQLYRTCFPYLLIGLGLPLLANLDVILLGILSTDSEVAMYAASARLVTLSAVGLTAVNLLIAPRLPILYSQKKFAEMQTMLRRNNIVILMLTILPVLVLAFAGSFVLSIFGEEYVAGVSILHILLVGQVINVFVGPVNLVCMMTHQHHIASLLTVAACVIEAALCYILIPSMGANGAAWANASALIFLSLSLALIVLRRVQVNPTLTNIIVGNRR